MDMNDLRAVALNRAADDCRTSEGFQAAPEVIVARAQSYLEFLLGVAPEPKPKKAKRVRS